MALMTSEMNQRHVKEISAVEYALKNLPTSVVELPELIEQLEESKETETVVPKSGNQAAGKKKNRQQLRKEKKAADMEEIRRQAEEEAGNSVNMREVEDIAISNILNPLNL
ncbi:hypothetical protein HK096_002605, partial [Nowakowskiella sp. JEL0078]